MTRTISDNNVNLKREREREREKKNITRCRKRFQIYSTNRRNRGKIDTPNIHMHDRSLSPLFTDTVIQSDGDKLIL